MSTNKVKFHLPGLRQNFVMNTILVDLIRSYPEYFHDNLEIGSFYGEFPSSRWNGGRISLDDQCDSTYIRRAIAEAEKLGIPIRYTYTNPLVDVKDLDDKYCNFCMREADNGKNEVLVVSPVLEKYIRENYPDYKVCSSTCKEIRDIEKVNEELKKDYHLVVLDYNFNNNYEILEGIQDKERCEILINPCCEPNCKRRGAHYNFLGRNQMKGLDNRALPKELRTPNEQWQCKYEHLPTIYSICGFSTFVSHDDLWEKYVPMGYCNFKIEGRTSYLFSVMDTYCYYMAKPQHRDAVRMLMLIRLDQAHIISVNKPKRMEF